VKDPRVFKIKIQMHVLLYSFGAVSEYTQKVGLLPTLLKKGDNCITALVLSCNCTFALIFLTLHVYPWFSKLKAPFAPVS